LGTWSKANPLAAKELPAYSAPPVPAKLRGVAAAELPRLCITTGRGMQAEAEKLEAAMYEAELAKPTVTLDLRGVASADGFHDAVTAALQGGIDEYYGRNLDAFADILFDGFGVEDGHKGVRLVVLYDRDAASRVPRWDEVRDILSKSKHEVSYELGD